MPKYGLSLIRIFLSAILFLYGEMRIQFCPYTGKYVSEKSRISAYFSQWLGRKNSFKLSWLHDFKVQFFLKTHCDRLTCKWNYKKKLSKLRCSKTFFSPTFSFCRQWVIAKANPCLCSEKRLTIKILQNSW